MLWSQAEWSSLIKQQEFQENALNVPSNVKGKLLKMKGFYHAHCHTVQRGFGAISLKETGTTKEQLLLKPCLARQRTAAAKIYFEHQT